MHILNSLALACGAKIDKPFVYESFFPLGIEKYITLQVDGDYPSQNYDYWQDVINILNPLIAKNGIRIVQVGTAKERTFSDCAAIKGFANFHQTAYLIRNALLHIGPDTAYTQVASAFDKPLVGVFNSNHVNCSGPFFGNKANQRIFAGYELAKQKPSYCQEESPKNINLIKPEDIAQAALDLIGINTTVPFETVFMGSKYGLNIIQESIPDHARPMFNPASQVEIRCDLAKDPAVIAYQLSQYQICVVIMDKPIPFEILQANRARIGAFVFKVSSKEQRPFIEQLRSLGKNIILISNLPEDQINQLKIHFYDFGNILPLEHISDAKKAELLKDEGSLYYRSCKITASNAQFFYSRAAALTDTPMQNHVEYQKVINTPEFWETSHCFTIVRLRKPLDKN